MTWTAIRMQPRSPTWRQNLSGSTGKAICRSRIWTVFGIRRPGSRSLPEHMVKDPDRIRQSQSSIIINIESFQTGTARDPKDHQQGFDTIGEIDNSVVIRISSNEHCRSRCSIERIESELRLRLIGDPVAVHVS